MPVNALLQLCLVLALAAFLHLSSTAQEPDVPDPTAESPAIQSQMEAVRGVEQLEALTRRIEQLVQQNAALTESLADTAERTKALESQLASALENQQIHEARRRAIPEMRLVAQVRTDSVRRADIEAAGRVYRVTDGKSFRLQLTDGQVVEAEVRFLEDDYVEVTLVDLESTQLLAFRPSASTSPRPASATRRNSVSD